MPQLIQNDPLSLIDRRFRLRRQFGPYADDKPVLPAGTIVVVTAYGYDQFGKKPTLVDGRVHGYDYTFEASDIEFLED